MIEDVESFGAKLQFEPLVDREFAPNRRVHLPGSKPSGEIARRVPLTRVYRLKRVGIDGPPTGASLPRQKIPNASLGHGPQDLRTIGAVKINGLTLNKTESSVIDLPGLQEPVSHQGHREPCSYAETAIKPPVTSESFQETVMPNSWQIV